VEDYKTAAGDHIEGVVIKAYECENELYEMFRLKKKMKGFDEIGKQKNSQQQTEIEEKTHQQTSRTFKLNLSGYTDEQIEQFRDYESYLNENRVVSALSKRPWTKNERHFLAEEILADALADFQLDNDDEIAVDFNMVKKVFIAKVFNLIKNEDAF
jgi:hypothetical protein